MASTPAAIGGLGLVAGCDRVLGGTIPTGSGVGDRRSNVAIGGIAGETVMEQCVGRLNQD